MTREDSLLQLDIIEELLPHLGKRPWETLYCVDDKPAHRFGMWCSLMNNEAAAKAMTHDSWDLMMDDGMPTFSQRWVDGEQVTTYDRFGSRSGIRPLVFLRSFHGAFRQYVELDEEFRLYHNLATDTESGTLLSFDASGRSIEVVRITGDQVQARLKHLRQFQAGTGLHLALFLDSVRYSDLRLSDVPEDQHRCGQVRMPLRWRRIIDKCDFTGEFQTISCLRGKAIIAPPPKESAGVWPFDEDHEEQDVSFIVSVDQNGNEVMSTSDPEKLNDYFGAYPSAHHYLTPVYFRREVLEKYFSEPDRYKVSDGYVSCLGLWGCRIDNDLHSHVVVFLGDLGRDLPYLERLHWRQFNVPPEGKGSKTSLRRNFLVEATDPKEPDLVFRQQYLNFVTKWKEAHGWSIFLPLSSGDEHLLDTIRIPVTDSQVEFDEQIIQLTKLLIDSLNEKALEAEVDGLDGGTKGIGKLSAFLEKTKFPQSQSVVQFLRDLQTLRSAGSAHRKGSRYNKIVNKLGIQPSRKPDAIRRILEEANGILQALRIYYCR